MKITCDTLLRDLAAIGARKPDRAFSGPAQDCLVWRGAGSFETHVDFDWTLLRTGARTVRAYVVDKGVELPGLSSDTCAFDEDDKCTAGDYAELVNLVDSWVTIHGVPAPAEFARAADALKEGWRTRLQESEARIDGQVRLVSDLLDDMPTVLPRPTLCDSLALGVHVVQPSAVLSWHSDDMHVQLDVHTDGRVVIAKYGRVADADGKLRLFSTTHRFTSDKQRREIHECLVSLLNDDKTQTWR